MSSSTLRGLLYQRQNQVKSILNGRLGQRIYSTSTASVATNNDYTCSNDGRVHLQALNFKKNKRVAGVLIDIDGVVVRGRKILPSARRAIEKLLEDDIPFLFLTNSGCETEECKANTLSKLIGLPIKENQMVLSHSPIRLLRFLHDKNIVVSGQGDVSSIAKSCGFNNVYSVEDLIAAFPFLNTNDRQRTFSKESQSGQKIPEIEAVILMGEPILWESHMQIILDILVSNGKPDKALPTPTNGKHIPLIAVNTDFLWMGEAPNPRFGNGAFLLCLESLYHKLTGSPLRYSGILGKPSLLTYEYACMQLMSLARQNMADEGDDGVDQCVFTIGDNLDTDIYGANLFNKLISGNSFASESEQPNCNLASKILPTQFPKSLKHMHSILVQTGVSQMKADITAPENLNHLHRDMPFIPSLRQPNHVTDDILTAVELICKQNKA